MTKKSGHPLTEFSGSAHEKVEDIQYEQIASHRIGIIIFVNSVSIVNSESKGFETHWGLLTVSLTRTLCPLLSIGSTQE